MGPLKENLTGYDEFYALWAFLSHSTGGLFGWKKGGLWEEVEEKVEKVEEGEVESVEKVKDKEHLEELWEVKEEH